MGRRSSFIDEPFGNDLLIVPAAIVEHAIGNSSEIARGHADGMGRMVLMKGKGPMLDAERLKESLDGELIVEHAGHVLANQRRMVQRMG